MRTSGNKMAENRPDRLETIIPVLIGVISILGAVMAGAAAGAESAAGDAQRAGLNAALNYEKASAAAQSQAYQHLEAAAEARNFAALADQLEAEAEEARARGDESAARVLQAEAQSHRAAAEASLDFAETGYLDPDGNFNSQSFAADQLAAVINFRDQDYDAADDFRLADVLSRRSSSLVNSVIGLSLAVLLLTVAQIAPRRMRLPVLALALAVLTCGLCNTLALETYFRLAATGLQ